MEALRLLEAGLRDLEPAHPNGWSHQFSTDQATESFSELPGGMLEIAAEDGFVSLAFGGALWEDLPLRTPIDADRILAACDAILLGNVSERRSGNWLVRSVVSRLQLTTRGFTESLEAHARLLFDVSGTRKPYRSSAA